MRRHLIGSIAGAVLLLAGLIALQRSYTAPRRYVKSCYCDNRELLDSLAEACREYDAGESGNVRLDAETAPESVRKILEPLRTKYQPDSENAVFSSCSVRYDAGGKMQLQICAKTEKAAGDGHTAPDLRLCYLVYLEDGYAEDLPYIQYMKEHGSIAGNWYFWSRDTYSG